MGKLTATEGRNQANTYWDSLNDVAWYARKNFNDMDFANNNRRDAVEEIIEEIERQVRNLQSGLDGLWFEE
jgi:hypothetical protein